MSAPTQRRSGGYLDRPSPSSLADVVELILDKGLVIDAYVRISLVGIELITIDARIVIASVDTYLRFAEATNRLDLYEHGGKGLTDLGESLSEGGARGKTKGALSGAKEKVGELLHGSDDDDEDEEDEEDEGYDEEDYEDEEDEEDEDEEEAEPARSRRRQPAGRSSSRRSGARR
jgi:gas vesicle structural protein